MRLHEEWRAVLRRAWSIRLLAAAFVFSALDAGFQLIDAPVLGLPDWGFAIMAGLASAGAFVARLLAQKGL